MTDTLTQALIGADYLEREGQATCEAVREVVERARMPRLSRREQLLPSQWAPHGWHWIERLFYEYGPDRRVPQWADLSRSQLRIPLFAIDGCLTGTFHYLPEEQHTLQIVERRDAFIVPITDNQPDQDHRITTYHRRQLGIVSHYERSLIRPHEPPRRRTGYYNVISTESPQPLNIEQIEAVGYMLIGALAAKGLYTEGRPQ